MFNNVIKTSIRNFYKRKVFSLVNILGLAIGITSCLLIMLWVNDEISYDRFHDNYKNIYRVGEVQRQGGEAFPVGVTPAPLGPAMKETYPEITNYVRIQAGVSGMMSHGEKTFRENEIILADSTFFEVFSFKLIMGDPRQVLSDPLSIVISEEIAHKYFGDQNPIGRVLTYENAVDQTVSGVFAQPSENSHITCDIVVPFMILEMFGSDLETSWNSNSYYTYIVLSDNTDHEMMNEKISGFLAEHDPGYQVEIHLQALADIHLKSDYTADWDGHGNSLYVNIFSLVAIFILLIACINFINLSLAQSPLRAKEIGIRKVLGANRKELIWQYLGESLMITLIALIIAIVLVEILLPVYNNFTGKELGVNLLNDPIILTGLILITIFTGLIAGSYPALVLSSFQPVKVLKGKLSHSHSGVGLRKILVVLQFTLAIALIVSTLVISRQVNLIRNIDLGYQKDHVIRIEKRGDANSQFDALKQELLKVSGVESVTTASINPINIVSSGYGLTWEDMPEEEARQHLVHTIRVSYDFLKTFDIKLKEGRSFSPDFPTDSLNYLCNSKVLEIMGENAQLGMKLGYYAEEYGELIGILEDFHFKSMHSEIEPLIVSFSKGSNLRSAYLRLDPANIHETIEQVEQVWNKFAPDSPFEFRFLDEYFDYLYNNEFRMFNIFRLFALLAIFISCLGLFGLVSYSTTCRIKEIGIRKVHGATVADILFLLLSQFTFLVLISNIFAWIPAWYFMNKWLQNFAYRIDLSIFSFLAASLLALIIAAVTTSFHAVKAALSDPVKALHYE